MPGKPLRISSTLAAIALALLTLTVFFVLRDYGPESAIRRFHDAVLNRDANAIAQVTKEGPADPQVRVLAGIVLNLAQRGANYRILITDREPSRVAAEVQYTLPDQMQGRALWVIDKQRGVWRINATETVAQNYRKALGL